jgi:hypothetical protein
MIEAWKMKFEEELAAEIQTARQSGIDESEIWELFEDTTPERRMIIFEHVLEAGVLDDDNAFEMLTTIRGDCDLYTAEGRSIYTKVLGQLRAQEPELFQVSSQYYHRDLILSAIIEGRWKDVPDLLAPYTTGIHLDIFTMVIAQLKYHGQVRTVIDAMTGALPNLKATDGYFEWAIEEFAGDLMELVLVDYLEKTPDPRPDDPELLDATASLLPWKAGWLEWFIPAVTGTEPTEWSRADFSEGIGSESWRERVNTLQLEFIGAQWRAGVPLARGLLAWHKWCEIFNAQFKTVKKPVQRRRGGKQVRLPLQRYLIPQEKRLDEVLAGSFSIMGGEPYTAAAALELIPAYLDFLERFELIQPADKQDAIQEIGPLVDQMPKIMEYYDGDPLALETLRAAWG